MYGVVKGLMGDSADISNGLEHTAGTINNGWHSNSTMRRHSDGNKKKYMYSSLGCQGELLTICEHHIRGKR